MMQTSSTFLLGFPAAVTEDEVVKWLSHRHMEWVGAEFSGEPCSDFSTTVSHRPPIHFPCKLINHQTIDGCFKAKYVISCL